jgi:hypothetical protein
MYYECTDHSVKECHSSNEKQVLKAYIIMLHA